MTKQPKNKITKVQRNDLCPCGSGKKYKRCCLGRVDWTRILRNGADASHLLSVRGRNLLFVEKIAGILQLDSLKVDTFIEDYKAAFTPKAVKAIHEVVMDVWPLDTDIALVLKGISGDVSGLYVGDYRIESVNKALVRHSTYANKILIVDPFIYPPSVRDEYNPILNPEQYGSQTLKSVNFYWLLLPWIQADIVNVIRTPAHFDLRLNWDSMVHQERKFKENECLREALEHSAEEMAKRYEKDDAFRELLAAPDDYIRRFAEEYASEQGDITAQEIMAYVEASRTADPDFLEPAKWGESRLTFMMSGANYEIAKLTAELTGSYLVTDLYSRWKEIELDRDCHNAENKAWAPFAKAVQNTSFKYLDQVSLKHALILREKGRLDSFRHFFHKVWRDAVKGDEYEEANAIALADELHEELRKAEDEWRKIDRDLLTMSGQGVAAALLVAAPLINQGHAAFLAAAVALTGGIGLTRSTLQRRGFSDRYPAAFFMDLSRSK